jgi:glycosyltransferase involved in cell wall biosynthesis
MPALLGRLGALRRAREKPKLLIDLTPLDTPAGPRGIGRYIRELARGLAELPEEELSGIELVGLTSLGWDGSYETTNDIGSFDGYMKTPPTEGDFYVWAYRQRVALWMAARRLGATAVHVLDPHATPLLLRTVGIKKIVTCHDLVPTRLPDHYFGPGDGGKIGGKLIERRRYRSADLVIAVSEATRTDVCSLLKMPPDRVVRVYNGLDLTTWSSAPPPGVIAMTLERYDLARRPFALYVGGSDWRKNAEGMMGGIARAKALGVDLDLVWAGHLDSGHIANVEAIARSSGVFGSLRRLGYVPDEDLAALYRAAVAHLFISRLEGFGLTIVEAMAAGCPVVTTAAGSLGEVAGDAALTVDPEDHEAIGQALVRLAKEPKLREDCARRGRERAPRFSRSALAKGTAEVYRRFLAIPS